MIRDGRPAGGLGKGLVNPNLKKNCYEILQRTADLDEYFGTRWAAENGSKREVEVAGGWDDCIMRIFITCKVYQILIG
jgi:hypothetical protein